MSDSQPKSPVSGVVFDIQRMSIHDGPGIRTTVFLKGCPLRCQWCHNPEGISPRPQLAFTPTLCIGCGQCVEVCPNHAHILSDGAHHIDRRQCTACFACAEECYARAIEAVGKVMTVDEVLREVVRDRPFYQESGGGLTLSGGEPLSQFYFARAVLEAAKAEGLHTCVETSGCVSSNVLLATVPAVDVFLFDCKETDPARHREYTGKSNDAILENLRALDDAGATIVLRCPIVPELNLRDDHLAGIAELAQSLQHCAEVQVLGYHRLGEAKRARVIAAPEHGESDGWSEMSVEQVEAVAARLRKLGVAHATAG